MKFTWWTYWVAKRRGMQMETLEFQQHASAMRGPHAWLTWWEFNDALRRRKKRERG